MEGHVGYFAAGDDDVDALGGDGGDGLFEHGGGVRKKLSWGHPHREVSQEQVAQDQFYPNPKK